MVRNTIYLLIYLFTSAMCVYFRAEQTCHMLLPYLAQAMYMRTSWLPDEPTVGRVDRGELTADELTGTQRTFYPHRRIHHQKFCRPVISVQQYMSVYITTPTVGTGACKYSLISCTQGLQRSTPRSFIRPIRCVIQIHAAIAQSRKQLETRLVY